MGLNKRKLSSAQLNKGVHVEEFLSFISARYLFGIIVALSLVAYLGFYATHYSVSVDQMVSEYYNGTALITAGRWCYTLLNVLTNCMQWAPFWNTLVIGVLLWISGLFYSYVFYIASGKQISNGALNVFWLFFAISPIHIYQVVYPSINIFLSYFFISVALYLTVRILILKDTKSRLRIYIVALLLSSIDMYESFAAVYLTAFFGVLIVNHLYVETLTVKRFFRRVIAICVFLLAAIALDFVISKTLCYMFSGSFEFWYKGNTYVAWTFSLSGNFTVLKGLFRDIYSLFVVYSAVSFSIFCFDFLLILGIVLFLIYSIKQKNILYLFLFLTMIISSFFIFIIMGRLPKFALLRFQTSPIITGFVSMIFADLLIRRNVFSKSKLIKYLITFVAVVFVLNSTLSANDYSVQVYELYEHDKCVLQDIVNDLDDYPTADKPVFFVAVGQRVKSGKLSNISRFSENPIAVLWKKTVCTVVDAVTPNTFWRRISSRYGSDITDSESLICVIAQRQEQPGILRGAGEHFVTESYRVLARMGYDIICPSTEDVKQINESETYQKMFENMSSYPEPGYIMENDDYIFVRFY